MTKTERTIALYVATSIAGALVLALLQGLAGGILDRGLDVADAAVWDSLGLRRFAVFKLGLFLTVFGVLLFALRDADLPRRLGAGLAATAVIGWAAKEIVFGDRALAALYVLLGVAATVSAAFEAWRRWAVAGSLGLVVAATSLAARGESLLDGRNFFTAVIVGVLFCAPAVALLAGSGVAVEAADRALDR
jgi:hypothetical protein